jgi:NAD-dependent deacetylase
MPDAAVRRAQDLAQACELLISIGSSLVVWPAAGLPLLAKRSGAMLAIINREPTDFDDVADLVVREDIGTALEPFVAAQSAA